MSRSVINLYRSGVTHKVYIGIEGKVYVLDKSYPLNDNKKHSIRKTAFLILKSPSMFSPVDPYYVEKDLIDTGMYLLYTDEQYAILKRGEAMKNNIQHTKQELSISKYGFEGILVDKLEAGDTFELRGYGAVLQVLRGQIAEAAKSSGQKLCVDLHTHEIRHVSLSAVVSKLYKSVTVKVE